MRAVFLMMIAVAGLLGLSIGPASAQATRTWVSGVGDDANPCTRTAPCKTFAGAISKTSAPGQINCLDPGGFGALTITKAISVDCTGVEAGVLVSGTNGITVSAGTGDTVVLKGLDFEGLGASLSGISLTQVGTLRIIGSTVRGFTTGVSLQPTNNATVEIVDSVIADNSGTGVLGKPSAFLRLMINRVRVLHNGGDGIMANATTSLSANIKTSIEASEASDNTGVGFVAYSGGATDQMLIDSSSAFNNVNSGVGVNGSGAVVGITRSKVNANGTGLLVVSPGVGVSYGTNSVSGNGTDGSFPISSQN